MSDGKGRDMIKTKANRAVEVVGKKWEEEKRMRVVYAKIVGKDCDLTYLDAS